MKESQATRKNILARMWREKRVEEKEREMGECLSILQDPELSSTYSATYVHTALHAAAISEDIGTIRQLEERMNRIRGLNTRIYCVEVDSQSMSSDFSEVLHGCLV